VELNTLVAQPAGAVRGIDRHPADRIDGEPSVGRVALPDGRDELDWVTDIAKRLPSAGLVQDPLKLPSARRGFGRQQDLAADCRRGHSRREVDGSADVVAATLYRGSVVHSDSDRRRAVTGEDVVSDS